MDENLHKISIVVPVYNVEQYIGRCIESLVNQTYENIEIILVDDGATDASGSICDKYAKEDSRIKVLHKINGGLSDARNAGLMVANGDYILFVDSDDYITLDACEQFSQFLNELPDIVMGDCVTENKGYSVKHYSELSASDVLDGKEYICSAIKQGHFPVTAWLNLYRKDYLKDNNLIFKKGILHEDVEFTPRAFMNTKKLIYSGIKFYYYITNDNSIMAKKDKRKNCSDVYDTGLEISRILDEQNNVELKSLLNDYMCNCYMGIFRSGQLYRYGKDYTHKLYVIKNAYRFRTRLKALLFIISPMLFCKIR